jgi:hypothetical protein
MLRSIFDELYRSFYDTFLISGMDVMAQSQEPASLWIPCTSISVETGCSPHIFLQGLI